MSAAVGRHLGAADGRARLTAVHLARAECEARLEAGQPMRAVQAYIDALPIGDAERRSVHVFARSYGERIPLPLTPAPRTAAAPAA